MKRTWAQKGFSSASEARRALTGQAMLVRMRTEEDFFREAVDVSAVDVGDGAEYVVVSAIGGVATADLVAEGAATAATADYTDTALPTAVSAAGTADPLTGAARGTAVERDSPVAVAL